MSKFEKSMQEIFDVTPTIKEFQTPTTIESNIPVVVSPIETKLENDLATDYKAVRKNYEDIIEKGVNALDDILEIAKQSEHPRAFEVAATLLKNVTDANEKFIALQKTMREMDKASQKESNKTTIDKAIFVGSTSELNKFLKNNKE